MKINTGRIKYLILTSIKNPFSDLVVTIILIVDSSPCFKEVIGYLYINH